VLQGLFHLPMIGRFVRLSAVGVPTVRTRTDRSSDYVTLFDGGSFVRSVRSYRTYFRPEPNVPVRSSSDERYGPVPVPSGPEPPVTGTGKGLGPVRYPER